MEFQSLVYEALAPEELTGVINQTDMEHRIMPGGVLSANVDVLVFEHATLQQGRYEMGVHISGAWPTGCVCLGLVVESPTTVAINGFLCPSRSVQLYSEGKELNYCAAPGSTWFAYCAPRDYIQSFIVDLFGLPLPIPHDGVVSFKPNAQLATSVTQLISSVFTSARTLSDNRTPAEPLPLLEQQLLYKIALCVFGTQNSLSHSLEIRHADKRKILMTRAEDFLMANLAEPFNLHRFALEVGTSARMLEYHFKKCYGITPNQWFRCMKLNAVRRELLADPGGSSTISRTAMAWGFSHLGRFSVEYRQLFGETPKQTTKRK
ncbi:MAG: helix-turn-helix domain-containing protein [Pseudomonadota bacterium]|nr:helix-turn-helix domain-containing protein [Pseudomonadota bacterium]